MDEWNANMKVSCHSKHPTVHWLFCLTLDGAGVLSGLFYHHPPSLDIQDNCLHKFGCNPITLEGAGQFKGFVLPIKSKLYKMQSFCKDKKNSPETKDSNALFNFVTPFVV